MTTTDVVAMTEQLQSHVAQLAETLRIEAVPVEPTVVEGELPLLYTIPEAAKMLGIGRTNVYQLMNDGRLRFVKIGKRRLVPRSVLEVFVEDLLEAS